MRIGFLGAGSIATQHAKRIANKSKVEIAAICSAGRASAEKMSATFTGGKAKAYDDFEHMLDEQELDALYVALPPYAHQGEVELAAKRKIALFLEKPIALSVDRAAAQVKAIERAKVPCHVGYHYRFAPAVQKLKQLIDDGSAGRVTLFQGTYFCNALHGPWWRDRKKSGGQTVEQAIHLYDLALHLCGQPKSVSAFADNLTHKNVESYTAEDTSAAIVQFKNGAMATVSVSNCAIPTEWRLEFRIVCENVTLDFRGPSDATLWHTGKPAEEFFKKGEKVKSESLGHIVDLYQLENDAFIAAVNGKSAPHASAREGLLGVKLVSAVMESAKSKGQLTPVS